MQPFRATFPAVWLLTIRAILDPLANPASLSSPQIPVLRIWRAHTVSQTPSNTSSQRVQCFTHFHFRRSMVHGFSLNGRCSLWRSCKRQGCRAPATNCSAARQQSTAPVGAPRPRPAPGVTGLPILNHRRHHHHHNLSFAPILSVTQRPVPPLWHRDPGPIRRLTVAIVLATTKSSVDADYDVEDIFQYCSTKALALPKPMPCRGGPLGASGPSSHRSRSSPDGGRTSAYEWDFALVCERRCDALMLCFH
uniref:Uncharacterized protein n=1 Tax=Mycena chlorophos TaxID=658473 RepID=A0ABQ0L5K3_MYCCL|nr:predicted protein [Mycena chlorophos]